LTGWPHASLAVARWAEHRDPRLIPSPHVPPARKFRQNPRGGKTRYPQDGAKPVRRREAAAAMSARDGVAKHRQHAQVAALRFARRISTNPLGLHFPKDDPLGRPGVRSQRPFLSDSPTQLKPRHGPRRYRKSTSQYRMEAHGCRAIRQFGPLGAQ